MCHVMANFPDGLFTEGRVTEMINTVIRHDTLKNVLTPKYTCEASYCVINMGVAKIEPRSHF